MGRLKRGVKAGAEAPPFKHAGSEFRADAPGLPFEELGLEAYREQFKGIRTRQHVNPLKRELQVPTAPLDWGTIYEDPTKPLLLDIGCGYGRFVLLAAKRYPEMNVLGLEIREKVVERAREWAKLSGMSANTHFEASNGTVSAESVTSTYPGAIDLIAVQYPDPHFKKKHHKRRIVQPALAQQIAKILPRGGRVLLQSDVLAVSEAMRDTFEQATGDIFRPHPEFHGEGAVFVEASPAEEGTEVQEDGGEPAFESEWAKAGWLKANPIGVPTEREVMTTERGDPVYRVLLQRM